MKPNELIELLKLLNGTDDMSAKLPAQTSLQVGLCYLIRTVTMMYTGRLTAITDTDLVLSDAAWIADSGRYSDALEHGTLDEVEPYPNHVIVGRAALVDAAEWNHALPREQK